MSAHTTQNNVDSEPLRKKAFVILLVGSALCCLLSLAWPGVAMAGAMTASHVKKGGEFAHGLFLMLSIYYPAPLLIGVIGGWSSYMLRYYRASTLWMLLPLGTFLAFWILFGCVFFL